MSNKIKLFTVLDKNDETTNFRTEVLFSEVQFLLKNSKYEVELSDQISDCDLILLDFLTTSYNDEKYKKSITKHLKIKDDLHYKTKNFIGVSYHEIHPMDIFEEKLSFIEKELNIKRERIFFIDTSLTNRNNYNDVPFEFKLRQFIYHVNDYKFENYKEKRKKKLTYLTNKVSFARFRVFDKVLFLYGDVGKLKNENNISILNNNFDSENGGKIDYYCENVKNLHFNKEFYDKLNLPWEIDKYPKEWEKNEICQSVYDFNNTSIFTLVLETENDHDLRINNTPFENQHFFEKININRLQISEKSVLPLFSSSMPFYIVDNLYYRTYEEIGYDFGYLKDIFDINYRTNTYYENYLELNKFINVIKNNSLDELNKIRDENMKYIENNLMLSKKLFEELTQKEEIFIMKMLNKI
jgi:hypothetical protein